MEQSISLEQARSIIDAGRAKAVEIGVPMNIAVVDAGNNLKVFERMDGAWLGSIDIAQGKAYTARAFDMPTADLAPEAQPDQSLFGINASNDGKIIIFPGGIPLMDGETIVGAVGVSGGAVDQDQAVAEAAVSGFQPLAGAVS